MELRDKLASQIGPVLWTDIRAHLARDGVIVVSPELELLEAALAVASNDVARVSDWIAHGKLGKPTPAQVELWSSDESLRFLAVVAAPYVLLQAPRPPVGPN